MSSYLVKVDPVQPSWVSKAQETMMKKFLSGNINNIELLKLVLNSPLFLIRALSDSSIWPLSLNTFGNVFESIIIVLG